MATKKFDVKQEDTLRWPDGWARTRIQDRRPNSQWKNTRQKYQEALIRELQMMGATSILITRNANERLDPGVSVWFSMHKEDFGWQDGLGIESPAPTLDEIDAAFRARAQKCHPDRADGGDIELFKKLNDYRKQARQWVLGETDQRHEFVVPCDRYNEARLNLAALRLAFAAFRSLERVGVPAILERTLNRAFKTALPMHASGGNDESDS